MWVGRFREDLVARPRGLRDHDYERLLEFRTGLRTFLKWSKDQAANAGLAPTQHQLLLAIRGHHDHIRGPTVGEVARYLLIKPHTAAELVNRASSAGLVTRVEDPLDGRVVRLRVTARGAEKLEYITEATFEELERLGPRLRGVWEGLHPTTTAIEEPPA
jgi:DNA-binding MarR family transcriptional regulator